MAGNNSGASRGASGSDVMMNLGPIRFGVRQQEYESLSTTMAWRWEEKARYLREPAQQYKGPASVSKTFKITIVVEKGADLEFLPAIRAEADKGEPMRLIAGHSKPVGGVAVVAGAADMGLWCITALDIDESHFLRDGTAMVYDATLSIKSYGEDKI